MVNGAPGMTRTCDLLVRSQTLYPTELRARHGVAKRILPRPHAPPVAFSLSFLSASMPMGLPAVIGTPNNNTREKLFRKVCELLRVTDFPLQET